MTSVERKTLLVAGAAAGMSATFASPIAAVLLAVELLLFEWKPRSLVPVALASATAGAARRYILGRRSAVSGSGASGVYRPEGIAGLRDLRTAGGCAFGAADGRRVRGRGCVSEAADSLDVVAGDRRPGGRRWAV